MSTVRLVGEFRRRPTSEHDPQETSGGFAVVRINATCGAFVGGLLAHLAPLSPMIENGPQNAG